MRKLAFFLLSCILLMYLMLPISVLAAETEGIGEEEPWSNEFSRIMDITDSLSKDEILRLDRTSMEIMREYHMDTAIAAIPEARLQGYSMETFASELYKSCDFGYGNGMDGFMCLYIEDTGELAVVPMGGAADVFPEEYLDFVEERVPSLREKYGVYDVFYGCQELIRSGLATLAEKAAGVAVPASDADTSVEQTPSAGGYPRCGEGSGMPVWFPADLDEAYVYFDEDAPRVVDYANIISDETETVMKARIAEITGQTGKDIVVVTDVSNFSLGNDVYAADFYDYNGYGIGQEHEGILLFLNMDPENRGGWTVETGSETRALATQSAANRLDDFLYEALASGDYDRALSDWVEDVYDVFTTGIARPSFWYRKDGEIPENYYDSGAPVVVDEWGLLNADQISILQTQAKAIKENYGVNIFFHTTGDRMGISRMEYNALYMESMGYEKDAVLFTVENTGGDTVKYSYVYLYGNMKEQIPDKFLSRIENNASAASDSFGRLFEGQRLLTAYLENGRVPRNGFYWTMIAALSTVIGFVSGFVSLSNAESSMTTVSRQTSAFSYLDRSQTRVRKISETLLYITTSRIYLPPKRTGSSTTRSSSGGSGYKSSYSGHSGVSHTGHGRNF